MNILPHRALDDIRSSIEELKYYRETVFKSKAQYSEKLEQPAPQGKTIALSILAILIALLAFWWHSQVI